MSTRKPKKIILFTLCVSVFSAFINVNGAESAEKRAKKTIYEDKNIPAWWKAGLNEYDDPFSLIKYEYDEDTGGESCEIGSDVEFDAEFLEEAEPGALIPTLPQFAAETTPGVGVSGTAVNGNITFKTYGYGHGVGLSQNGANAYATYKGYNYTQILQHYYPGVTLGDTGTADTEMITVNGVQGTVMDLVPLIVNNEIGGNMHAEAIKAQIVAIYTYIKYNGNNGKDLRPKANPSQKIIDLCQEVLGQAVYYNGSFANTMFYASSGGATASCKDVFSANVPYLTSVPCDVDAAYDQHYGSEVTLSAATVKAKLEAKYNIKITGEPSTWFRLVTGDGGYVSYVVINEKTTVKGNEFRACLGLKSPKYSIAFS